MQFFVVKYVQVENKNIFWPPKNIWNAL